MGNIRAEVTVHGRVQGVGFRFSTLDRADALALPGWVRNTWRRTVEAVFEGDEADVRDMVRWCRTGPAGARVTRLDVRYADATGEFNDFRVTG